MTSSVAANCGDEPRDELDLRDLGDGENAHESICSSCLFAAACGTSVVWLKDIGDEDCGDNGFASAVAAPHTPVGCCANSERGFLLVGDKEGCSSSFDISASVTGRTCDVDGIPDKIILY